MSLRTGRVRVNVQVAKIAAERLVAFHVERLIAKEQDLMLRQRLVQLLDLVVAERLGERQAVDLGANARRDRRDVDGFVAHGVTSIECGENIRVFGDSRHRRSHHITRRGPGPMKAPGACGCSKKFLRRPLTPALPRHKKFWTLARCTDRQKVQS